MGNYETAIYALQYILRALTSVVSKVRRKSFQWGRGFYENGCYIFVYLLCVKCIVIKPYFSIQKIQNNCIDFCLSLAVRIVYYSHYLVVNLVIFPMMIRDKKCHEMND